MRVYVTGSSALHYWRRHVSTSASLQNCVPNALADCPIKPFQLEKASLDNGRFGPVPIHLLVPSYDLRISKRTFRYSIHEKLLPETAFCQIEDNVCVASPEYCLFQSSRVFSLYRLLELSMELCGKYSLVPESTQGFISRDYCLASAASLRHFFEQMKGESGTVKMKRILPFVQDGSRSPMETRAYILMCMPKRLGGYGLPKPLMNARIQLASEEQVIAKRSYFECDICWPDHRVIIEYDGQAHHSALTDIDRDSIKRNILLSKGYVVITLTSNQLCNMQTFDKIVREVAKKIGFRLRAFPEKWHERRWELRKELFKSLTQTQDDLGGNAWC